jgi:hypothetical protein
MSKWINKDLFSKFQDQKKEEKEAPRSTVRRSDFVWPTPDKGTDTDPKVYKLRFLPDPNGNFYKMYYYHMYKSGEKWVFTICPKTDGFDNYCPLCSITSKLYMGSQADKRLANNYKRKKKFVGNTMIVNDPRDSEREEDKKVNGLVKLYEFPQKVEMKLKEEITDPEGLGVQIFDPGKDGFDFVLKVLATKRDESGNSWPDYAQSNFSRRATPVAESEGDIDEIMKSCVDINEYVDGMKKDEAEIVKLIKAEMLFDMVKDEWKRETEKKALTTAVDDIDDVAIAANVTTPEIEDDPAGQGDTGTAANTTAESQEKKPADDSPFKSDDELDDAALIAELESM